MIRMKALIKSLTYEGRLFVQIMVLVTVPLLVMGIVSYSIYIKGESAQNEMTLDYYSDDVFQEYENIFTALKEYYMDCTRSETFNWLVHQEEVPYSRFSNLRQAQNLLQGNYFMTHYISTYQFINVKHGWVLNDYGMFPLKDAKNREEVETFLKEQGAVLMSVYWIDRSGKDGSEKSVIKPSNSVDTSGLLLAIKNEHSVGGLSYMILVQIDEMALRAISQSYARRGYEVAIMGDDSVLLETSSDLTEAYLSDVKQKGIGKTLSGKKYNMAVRQSDSSGLIYVVGYDTAQVKRDGTVFLWASLVVVAAFGLLFVVVKLAAAAFSKPILSLQKFVSDQSAQIRELLVSNLVKGELDEEKIAEALKRYNIVPCNSYRMIGVTCKNDENRLDTRILLKFPEELQKELFITPISHEDILIFLVGDEGDMEVDNRTASIYKEIKDFIEETSGYTIASGISRIFHKLTHTRRAWDECAQALHSKSNREEGELSSLVLFDDYLSTDRPRNTYDIIMENELINAIESCNTEEADRLLELIVERMEVRGVAGIERNFYITRLLTAMMAIPVKFSVSLGDVFDGERYNIISQITQVYNTKAMLHSIETEMIHPIVEKLEEKKQESQVSEIVAAIMYQIKETRGMISLNECAQMLNYHPNYLCKVLKREKGVNFTDLVSEEKLKLAKYMLLTTEYSIAEISEKLQYNNAQNFIRFFKNHTGITPSTYRKDHRQ